MNGMIDLMPQRCRETLGRRRRVRGWVGVYGAMILLVGAAYWGAISGQGVVEDEVLRMVSEREERLNRNEEVQALLAEKRELERVIRRYNKLAWPIRVSEVIDILGTLTPDAVTLRSMSMTPREVRKRGQVQGEERIESMLIIELEGIGPSDNEVAVMVSGLESHPVFSKVSLDFTRSTEVDELDVREFRMTGVIDLNARYEFVASGAPEGGGL